MYLFWGISPTRRRRRTLWGGLWQGKILLFLCPKEKREHNYLPPWRGGFHTCRFVLLRLRGGGLMASGGPPLKRTHPLALTLQHLLFSKWKAKPSSFFLAEGELCSLHWFFWKFHVSLIPPPPPKGTNQGWQQLTHPGQKSGPCYLGRISKWYLLHWKPGSLMVKLWKLKFDSQFHFRQGTKRWIDFRPTLDSLLTGFTEEYKFGFGHMGRVLSR